MMRCWQHSLTQHELLHNMSPQLHTYRSAGHAAHCEQWLDLFTQALLAAVIWKSLYFSLDTRHCKRRNIIFLCKYYPLHTLVCTTVSSGRTNFTHHYECSTYQLITYMLFFINEADTFFLWKNVIMIAFSSFL